MRERKGIGRGRRRSRRKGREKGMGEREKAHIYQRVHRHKLKNIWDKMLMIRKPGEGYQSTLCTIFIFATFQVSTHNLEHVTLKTNSYIARGTLERPVSMPGKRHWRP